MYSDQTAQKFNASDSLDGLTGFNAVCGIGKQFLTALPFQGIGFASFACSSTCLRLALSNTSRERKTVF